MSTTIRDELRIACIRRKINFADVAAELNIVPSAVSRWFERGKIPAERVLALERMTGVSRTLMRPDLYPPETKRARN